MFRVAVVVSDASQGWVKCGCCKKIFDCRNHQIDPADFVEVADNSVADSDKLKPDKHDSESQFALIKDKEKYKNADINEPQIPLFKEEVTKDVGPKSKPIVSAIPKSDSDSTQTVKNAVTEDQSNVEFTQQDAQEVVESGITHLKIEQKRTAATTKKNKIEQRANLKVSSGKIKPARTSKWTKSILAQAQSWKKEKNRFKPRKGYSAMLLAIALVVLLIWQIVIVNYTKLAEYNFLSSPLNLVCAVFSCNREQPPGQKEFEILHANLRRHGTKPGVITISANLINYSNIDKLLPNVRLDLTDMDESIVASRIINLVDNPQYIDPAISRLEPGQDVKLIFDIEQPVRTAVGFELNIVGAD